MTTHVTTCPLCEAMCGLRVDVDGGAVTGIRGDPDDVLSRGFLCPKATALADLQADPERLREPLVRRGSTWQTASWEEALDEAAAGLHRVRAAHGANSVAFYSGNPNLHSYTAQLAEIVFKAALGTQAVFSTASADQLPHLFASYLMFGHQLLLPIPDLDRTSFLLVVGANPAESNGSLMGAPGMPQRLRDLRARGGRLVVVDPRRTRTAEIADAHHFIVPGTDALLLAAMVHVVIDEGLARPGRLAAFTRGLETVARAVAAFTPERVAATVGIGAAEIRSLARTFSAAPAAVCYPRFGACTQEFGALSCWLGHVLNTITGNLDREGGSMFSRPAVDIVRVTGLIGDTGSYASFRSRLRGLPEFNRELPTAALAEEIAAPGPGGIRALITSAGNPVLTIAGGDRLDRAMPSLEFVVAIDFYVNETTRHANVILPPVFALERDHYDVAFRAFGVRNTAKYSGPVLPPPPGSMNDWDIYLDLAARLLAKRGGLAAAASRAGIAAARAVGPQRLLDLLLRTGPHRLSLARLRKQPQPIDLGPLTPCLPGRLYSRGRQIDLAPEPLLRDLARLSERVGQQTPDGSLLLIGRRQLRNKNSWLHNAPRLMTGPDRCTLVMHPDDARARGIADGVLADVTSASGRITVPVEVSERIMAGVVSLPHGFGHTRAGTRLTVAQATPGASLNDLTGADRVDALTGTAAFSGTPVVVTAAGGAALV